MYHYKAYYLKIASEVEFSEFSTYEADVAPDLHIVFGKTPEQLEGDKVIKKVQTQATTGKFLLKIKGAGRIYITNGTKITIELEENGDWDLLRLYLRARALAAIIHQRRWGLLHGSAIAANGKAILFLGDSGAGKSTTAGAFIKKGYSFISDDLCVIRKFRDQAYQLYPAYPQLRLWEDALDLIDAPNSLKKGSTVRNGLNKYFVSPETKIINKPIPISHIYILSWNQSTPLQFHVPSSFDSLQFLLYHTFANGQMKGLGGHQEQFKMTNHLLKTAQIKVIKRPRPINGVKLWELIDLLEDDFLNK